MPLVTTDVAEQIFDSIDSDKNGTINKMPQLHDYCTANHVRVSSMIEALGLSSKFTVAKWEFMQASTVSTHL